MLLFIQHYLLILYEFEFIELNDHVFFELVPEFLNLLLFVRVVLDIIFFLEYPLNLTKFVPVLSDLGLQLLHFLEHLVIDLRGCGNCRDCMFFPGNGTD